MRGARWATLLSAALATPLLLLLILVRLDYEPPFLPLLTNPDGTPTTAGPGSHAGSFARAFLPDW